MTEWADHHEELSRKTIAALDDRIKEYDAGKISDREFQRLVETLYDVTSGLITRAVSVLLAKIHEDVSGRIKTTKEEEA